MKNGIIEKYGKHIPLNSNDIDIIECALGFYMAEMDGYDGNAFLSTKELIEKLQQKREPN